MKKILLALILILSSVSLTHAAGGLTTPVICAGAPASCTYTIVSTGNLIIACGANGGGGETVLTPTASGVTFTQITANQFDVNSGLELHCFTGISVSTGSTAFSFSSQFGDSTFGVVTELSGVSLSSMNDTNNFAGAASGANMASGAFVTTATDIILGFGIDNAASTPTAGSGWTKTSPAACTCTADARLILEYQLDVTAASYNATATKSASSGWAIQGFGIKEPGGGGTIKGDGLMTLGIGPGQ